MTDNKEHKKENIEVCKKCEEMEAKCKRALADYQNLKNRTEEEKLQVGAFANEALLKKLLPFFDNLEKVAEHSQDEGFKLTLKDLDKILKEIGLEEVDPTGKEFNPLEMEAVDMVEGEKNKIVKTTKKGFLFNGKLIRPAQVVVGFPKKEE